MVGAGVAGLQVCMRILSTKIDVMDTARALCGGLIGHYRLIVNVPGTSTDVVFKCKA
jgi:hypothetical protein